MSNLRIGHVTLSNLGVKGPSKGRGSCSPGLTVGLAVWTAVIHTTGLLEIAGLHDSHGDLVEAVVENVQTGDGLHSLRGAAGELLVGARCLAHVAIC